MEHWVERGKQNTLLKKNIVVKEQENTTYIRQKKSEKRNYSKGKCEQCGYTKRGKRKKKEKKKKRQILMKNN